MKMIRKVIAIGNSKGITLSKGVIDSMEISEGEYLEVDIKKVKFVPVQKEANDEDNNKSINRP